MWAFTTKDKPSWLTYTFSSPTSFSRSHTVLLEAQWMKNAIKKHFVATIPNGYSSALMDYSPVSAISRLIFIPSPQIKSDSQKEAPLSFTTMCLCVLYTPSKCSWQRYQGLLCNLHVQELTYRSSVTAYVVYSLYKHLSCAKKPVLLFQWLVGNMIMKQMYTNFVSLCDTVCMCAHSCSSGRWLVSNFMSLSWPHGDAS